MRIEHEHEFAVAREPLVRVLSDVPAVIACIPGAAVTTDHGDGTYDAEIGAHYGEMAALFRGRVTVGGGGARAFAAPDSAAEAFTARVEGHDALTGITAEVPWG